MSDISEPLIRLGAFVCVLIALAFWERAAPRRAQSLGRLTRWSSNLCISVLNTALVRVLLPTTAVGLALVCEAKGWGLLQVYNVPRWLAVVLGFIVMDLAIYLQHIMFHAAPALWRLHRMHHADQEFDVTTGVRFHPVEVLLSMVLKFAVIVSVGTPALTVLLFEIMLNATSMFSHSNVAMPLWLDRVLRWILVTPDMHRVHHSIVVRETNSNFGFNLPWWDRLFGTYRPQPEAGHEGMTLGVKQFRDASEQRLDRMLTQPLREDARDYPLGRSH